MFIHYPIHQEVSTPAPQRVDADYALYVVEVAKVTEQPSGQAVVPPKVTPATPDVYGVLVIRRRPYRRARDRL